MRVLATMVLLMLALVGGCGGDDDGGTERPATVLETVPSDEPEPAPAEPGFPGDERAAAIKVVSRYADALQGDRFERACALVAARDPACEAKLERFAQTSDVVDLTRTVPIWDRGTVDAGTGALAARVKIGFPARPEIRWTFRLVQDPGGPWLLTSAVPSEMRAR